LRGAATAAAAAAAVTATGRGDAPATKTGSTTAGDPVSFVGVQNAPRPPVAAECGVKWTRVETPAGEAGKGASASDSATAKETSTGAGNST